MSTTWRRLAGFVLMSGLMLFGQLGAAPLTNQAPGFFRYAVGDFIVTALQDGVIDLQAPRGYQGMDAKKIEQLIARSFLLKKSGVQTSVNAYLVDTGTHRILVDAGNANCYGWSLHGVTENLRAAGYAPEVIDIIVITHLHGDHVCGLLTADGKRQFPNATVWAAKEEAAYWLGDKAPASARKMVSDALAPYGDAFHTFAANESIAPGMRIVPIPGHTPGQTAYLFESKGAAMLAFGDIVHCYPVQFPHPEVTIASDVDRQQAAATRKAVFERAAKDELLIAGSHLPFPGLGHIRKEGRGFSWIPVEFGPLKN